jgi:hypothetical protein
MMNIAKTPRKWLAQLGETFRPQNEVSRKVRAGTALLILLLTVAVYLRLF